MTKQPLHEVADSLYVVELNLGNLLNLLDQGKIVTVIRNIQKSKDTIHKAQFTIRETALRDEGEHAI